MTEVNYRQMVKGKPLVRKSDWRGQLRQAQEHYRAANKLLKVKDMSNDEMHILYLSLSAATKCLEGAALISEAAGRSRHQIRSLAQDLTVLWERYVELSGGDNDDES